MQVKLTKPQYLAAGQKIMLDPRCTAAVKAAVRQGTSGEIDSNGMYTYIPAGGTWFDAIIISAAGE